MRRASDKSTELMEIIGAACALLRQLAIVFSQRARD